MPPPESKKARIELEPSAAAAGRPVRQDEDEFFDTQSDEFWRAIDESVLQHMRKGDAVQEVADAGACLSTVVRSRDQEVPGACLRFDGLSRFESTQRPVVPVQQNSEQQQASAAASQVELLSKQVKEAQSGLNQREGELKILRYQCTQACREKELLQIELDRHRNETTQLQQRHRDELAKLQRQHSDELRFAELDKRRLLHSSAKVTKAPVIQSQDVAVVGPTVQFGSRKSTQAKVRPVGLANRSAHSAVDNSFIDRRSFYSNVTPAGRTNVNEHVESSAAPMDTSVAAFVEQKDEAIQVRLEEWNTSENENREKWNKLRLRRYLRNSDGLGYLRGRLELTRDDDDSFLLTSNCALFGITAEQAKSSVQSQQQ